MTLRTLLAAMVCAAPAMAGPAPQQLQMYKNAGGQIWLATVDYDEQVRLDESGTMKVEGKASGAVAKGRSETIHRTAHIEARAWVLPGFPAGANAELRAGADDDARTDKMSGRGTRERVVIEGLSGSFKSTEATGEGTRREGLRENGSLSLDESGVSFSFDDTTHTFRFVANMSWRSRAIGDNTFDGEGHIGPVAGTKHVEDDAQTPSQDATSLEFDQTNGKMRREGKRIILDYGFQPPVEETNEGNAYVKKTKRRTTRITAHVTIDSAPADFTAQLVPVDPDAYGKWLPVVPSANSELPKDAEKVSFRVVVRRADGSTDDKEPRTTVYTLVSSHEPGECMNFPAWSKKPNVDADLVFDDAAARAAGGNVDAIAGTLTYPSTATGLRAAPVLSRDWGAWGTLRATVTMLGQTVTASFAYGKSAAEYATVPLDENDNKIADPWERNPNAPGPLAPGGCTLPRKTCDAKAPPSCQRLQDACHPEESIFEKNYRGSWDEERDPNDKQGWEGDGLALYEEYRGFMLRDDGVNTRHKRLSPRWKEFVAYLPEGDVSPLGRPAYNAGIRLYEKITNIGAHFIVDPAAVNMIKDRGYNPHPWINFNTRADADLYGPHAYGIHFVESKMSRTVDYSTCAASFTGDDGALVPLLPKWRFQSTFSLQDPLTSPDAEAGADHSPIAPQDAWEIVIRPRIIRGWIDEWVMRLGLPDRGCCKPRFLKSSQWNGKTYSSPSYDCWLLPDVDDFLTRHKVTLHGALDTINQNRDQLIFRFTAFAVAHELRHSMGSQHHSDLDGPAHLGMMDGAPFDCPMRYWSNVPVEAMAFLIGLADPSQGAWDPATEKLMSWKFDDAADVGAGTGVPRLKP